MEDYVGQKYSINPDGSESSPYPNINAAIFQNQDKFTNLVLILIVDSTPYNFSQNEFSLSLNLTLTYFLIILLNSFSLLFKNEIWLKYDINSPF